MEDSIFTKIIKGELPSHKVYEDNETLAFLSINPHVEGHTLVVPKQQINSLQATMKTSKKVASRLQDVLNPKRVGVVVEGFEVPHAHIHLIPLNKSTEETLSQCLFAENKPSHPQLAATAKKLFFSN